MSFTVTVTEKWNEGSDALSRGLALDCDVIDKVSVPVNSSNQKVDLAFKLAELVTYFILADKDTRLETNSPTAGGEVFHLQANVPMRWHEFCGLPKHFSNDVTAIYLTDENPTAPGHPNVEIRIARNQNP